VGSETKKSAARGKADTRGSAARASERVVAAATTKRPSAAPASASTVSNGKKKSVPPPAVVAANDNDHGAKPKQSAAPAPMGRGRLPTGSLHTEARPPAQAENLKARLTALMTAQQKLADLKRSANKNFYEIGEVLHRVREQRLYEVKGYGSFDSFLDREVNLGQQFCLTVVRIYETFLPAAVTSLGLNRLSAAVRALDDEPAAGATASASDTQRGGRSPIPPHKL